MKVPMALSNGSRASVKEKAGDVVVIFMHSTGKANKRTQRKQRWAIKAHVDIRISSLTMFICYAHH